MKRQARFSTVCLAALLAAPRPAPAQPSPHPAPAPDIVVTPETRTHAISATTAARLSATAPKFIPPADASAATAAASTRLQDKPKNGIVRLPDYIINEPKPPAFKERELLTGYGRVQLAYQRHPGLHVGSLPIFSNNGIALFMLEEEFRLERKKEMEDLAGLLTSPVARARAKDETQAVFMRTSAP